MGNHTIEQTGHLEYESFLERKRIVSTPAGFDPRMPINPMMTHDEFRFQGDIAKWAIRRGRAAIWAGTGLGKTGMELEWARHVYDHIRKPVMILCPLAVAEQFAEESIKFNIANVAVSRGDVHPITVTNYDIISHFNPDDFGAIVLDESGILKAFDGATRKIITEFAANIPYRLSASATPAPNDYVEIGTQCEFLGIMSRTEMLATFFVHDGGDTSQWRLKRHAADKFWEWVASWAVMLTKPSDLGYQNGKFDLPPIEYHDIVVPAQWSADFLFPVEASTLSERRNARKDSVKERVDKCIDLVCSSDEQWLVWCDLNSESEAIAKGINDCVEIRGSDTREKKRDAARDFKSGAVRVLVSKPSIYGWGLNFQNCRNVVFVGLSDSFEAMYQAVRRCWRFGQSQIVRVYVITSELEGAVVRNIQRKEQQYDEMTQSMVKHMAKINEANIHMACREVETYERGKREAGDGRWIAFLGDACEVMREMDDDCIGYSIYSPPFASLYTYTQLGSRSWKLPHTRRVHAALQIHCARVVPGVEARTLGFISLHEPADIERTPRLHRASGLSW